MKYIYLDVTGKRHSLYNELINYPPKDYQFNCEGSLDPISRFATSILPVKKIHDTVGEIIPLTVFKSKVESIKKIPKNISLTYSTGHLIFRREPWIVDMEFVTHLTGYHLNHFIRHKKLIEKSLSSDYCKNIIPWTDAGTQTILQNLDCEAFIDKIETVHLAVHKKDFKKNYNNDKVKILFVASANFPKDFDLKGGKEVLEAFEYLNTKYDHLELVIRSYVPQHLKDKYAKFNNIRIIDSILPWSELEKEFTSSDIFLFPSHNTPGMVFLDAMSYELPIITTDVWANHEMVEDGSNGFLIHKSDKINYYVKNFIPNWFTSDFIRTIETTDPNVVNGLVEKTSILIDNENLRRKMGKAGRQEIEIGKFSIEKRNEKLKRIFDKAF